MFLGGIRVQVFKYQGGLSATSLAILSPQTEHLVVTNTIPVPQKTRCFDFAQQYNERCQVGLSVFGAHQAGHGGLLFLRFVEGAEQPVAHFQGVFHRLEAGGVFTPVVIAEVLVFDAGGGD